MQGFSDPDFQSKRKACGGGLGKYFVAFQKETCLYSTLFSCFINLSCERFWFQHQDPRFPAGNRWPRFPSVVVAHESPGAGATVQASWSGVFHVGVSIYPKNTTIWGDIQGAKVGRFGMVGIRKKIVDHVILVKAGIKRGEPTGFWTLRHYGTFWCRFFWCSFCLVLLNMETLSFH